MFDWAFESLSFSWLYFPYLLITFFRCFSSAGDPFLVVPPTFVFEDWAYLLSWARSLAEGVSIFTFERYTSVIIFGFSKGVGMIVLFLSSSFD